MKYQHWKNRTERDIQRNTYTQLFCQLQRITGKNELEFYILNLSRFRVNTYDIGLNYIYDLTAIPLLFDCNKINQYL